MIYLPGYEVPDQIQGHTSRTIGDKTSAMSCFKWQPRN